MAWIPVKPNDISYLQFPPSHKILVPFSIENIALRWRPLFENQLMIGLWILIENCYTQSVTLDLLNWVCTKECHNMGVDKTLMHQEPAQTTNITLCERLHDFPGRNSAQRRHGRRTLLYLCVGGHYGIVRNGSSSVFVFLRAFSLIIGRKHLSNSASVVETSFCTCLVWNSQESVWVFWFSWVCSKFRVTSSGIMASSSLALSSVRSSQESVKSVEFWVFWFSRVCSRFWVMGIMLLLLLLVVVWSWV